MDYYIAKDMKIDDTFITLEIEGKGRITADLSGWADLLKSIGGVQNIKKAKLLGDLIVFPNDIHVEVADILALAEKHKKSVASFSDVIDKHYDDSI
jgi:hypothetical protein